MLSLALASLALLPPAQAPTTPTALAAAPEEAIVLVYTPDVAAARGALLESPWYRYFVEGPGTVYVEALRGLLESPDAGLDDFEGFLSRARPALDFARGARGEALLFVDEHGLGLLLRDGEQGASMDEQLDRLLEAATEPRFVTRTTRNGRTLETWRMEPEDEFVLARGRGLGVTAIVLGDGEQQVLAGLDSMLTRLASGATTAATRRIAGRLRGAAPRLVLDVDLQRLAALGASEEPQVATFVEALGLDRENYILGDWHRAPGGLHEVVQWNFDSSAGFAGLADSFRPLEMSDLAHLPLGTREFGVLRWQPRGFLDAVLELAGDEAGTFWRDAMQAGESASGVRFDRDVIAQLSGTFASYYSSPAGVEGALLDPLQGATLQIGVHDGAALEETFAQLLEATGVASRFELESYGDYDVWVPVAALAEGASLPRLVFTENMLLIVSGSETLEHALAPFTGEVRPSLADDSAPVEALRRHSGAFFLSYQELAASMARFTGQLHDLAGMAQLELGEAPALALLREWFPGVRVSAAQRTARGVELRSSLR